MTRVSLEAGQVAAVAGGWLQERYHSSGGDAVGEFLSFRAVYEINPFEVGACHARARADYRTRRGVVEEVLELRPLRRRPLASLSNGEMRRVVLARALLRESGPVVVEGAGGLDPVWRRRLRAAARALRPFGISLRFAAEGPGAPSARARTPAPPPGGVRRRKGEALVEISGVDVAFGRRKLLRDFSWTIRAGERWILRGPNGSGKTTLFALITGDSPRAYALDIRVFGRRRGEEGASLADMRAQIGEVSSLREAYLGLAPERQLDDALRPGVQLLLLDEPCCNLTAAAAGRFARRVVAWLNRHPRAAAVWVEHRGARIPPEFSLVRDLSDAGGGLADLV